MSETTDKTPEPRDPNEREGLMDRVPIRIRTFLWATGLVVGFGAFVALMGAIFINQMKNQLVEIARTEVREAGNRASHEIERIVADLERHQGRPIESINDVVLHEAVQAEVRILNEDQHVVLSALLDSDGNCAYEIGGDGDLMDCPTRPGSSLHRMIPDQNGPLFLEFDLSPRPMPVAATTERIPIRSGDRKIGYVAYEIEEAAALRRLEPISNHITGGLRWMAGLIIVSFGAAVLLLLRVGSRHAELSRRHEEAQHLARIGTMASGLAHEIRNPLHAMNLHLEAARDELEEPAAGSTERAAKTVAGVQHQITSLSEILSNFMNFAKPPRIESEPMPLRCLVHEVTRFLEPEFDNSGVTLSRDVPESAWIEADQSGTRQVLTNVLMNAVQILEGREEREIRIAARHEGNRWLLEIADTGPGLPQDHEDEIFDVFFSKRKGGSGFGLAIARRLMEAQGGSITARNDPDGGAVFRLAFRSTTRPADYREPAHSGLVPREPETIG